VEEVLRREGEAVREGDVLVRLHGASWERELAEARKAGDAAREGKAKEALASLEVRAPEAGIVWRMHARRGEMPLTYRGEPLPLVELFDWTRLRFEGTAPAALAEILDGGAPVLVRHGKDVLTAARVASRGAPGPDGSFAVVAVPTAPPGEAPEPDGPGEVHVATGVEEALAVPAGAVRTVDGRPCVHVVTVTGELVRTPVVLGLPLPDRRIAISGVDPLASVAVWE
jgi:hypothetical protein